MGGFPVTAIHLQGHTRPLRRASYHASSILITAYQPNTQNSYRDLCLYHIAYVPASRTIYVSPHILWETITMLVPFHIYDFNVSINSIEILYKYRSESIELEKYVEIRRK